MTGLSQYNVSKANEVSVDCWIVKSTYQKISSNIMSLDTIYGSCIYYHDKTNNIIAASSNCILIKFMILKKVFESFPHIFQNQKDIIHDQSSLIIFYLNKEGECYLKCLKDNIYLNRLNYYLNIYCKEYYPPVADGEYNVVILCS